MDVPSFKDIFKQIKINFWLIGIPFDQPKIKIRYFLLLLNLIIVVIEEVAFFFSKFSAENFLELCQLAPCTFIGALTVSKIIIIAFKRQNVFDLTQSLKELYDEVLNDTRKRAIVRQDFVFLKYLVKIFFILNAILISVYNFSTLTLMSYNYYANNVVSYNLPYAVLVPFSTDSWQTWLLVYLHSITCGFICVLFFTTVDALYFILTSHICAQFAVLSDEIKHLDQSTSHRLRKIVKKHQYILKYLRHISPQTLKVTGSITHNVRSGYNRSGYKHCIFGRDAILSQDLELIFRGPNLCNVLVGSLEICALGFNLTMGKWAQVPGVVLFLSSVLIQILMISVFGESLIRESRKVGEAAFLCKWYNMDQKSKKLILIIMLRSNKPQKLTAYKFSVISYESFTKIISTSWTYFTILRTIYTPPEINNN